MATTTFTNSADGVDGRSGSGGGGSWSKTLKTSTSPSILRNPTSGTDEKPQTIFIHEANLMARAKRQMVPPVAWQLPFVYAWFVRMKKLNVPFSFSKTEASSKKKLVFSLAHVPHPLFFLILESATFQGGKLFSIFKEFVIAAFCHYRCRATVIPVAAAAAASVAATVVVVTQKKWKPTEKVREENKSGCATTTASSTR